MPKDDWAKARAKDLGKRVIAKSATSDEYRAFGIETTRTKPKKEEAVAPVAKKRKKPLSPWVVCSKCKSKVRSKNLAKHKLLRCNVTRGIQYAPRPRGSVTGRARPPGE